MSISYCPEENCTRDNIQFFYEGYYDPEVGGCYTNGKQESFKQEGYSDEFTHADEKHAYMNHQLFAGDITDNQYEDLVILVHEQDCQTKKFRTIDFVVSPETNGLNVTSIRGKEDANN